MKGLRLMVAMMLLVALAGCSRHGHQIGSRETTTSVPVTQVTAVPSTAPASNPTVTTTTQTPVPTLGTSAALTGYARDGKGFGQVEPSEVYLGGDPTGRVSGIVWQSWGGPEAKGTGQGWWVDQGKTVGEGSTQPVTIVAFNLATCGGRPAYQTVEWFFPGRGHFDPGLDADFCTTDGKRSGSDRDTAELAARCVLGAFLRNDLTRASVCADSPSTAGNLFGQLAGYDRTVLADYALDFTGCPPAPGGPSAAGAQLACMFGHRGNDDPAGVWMIVNATGPPFHVANIGPG